MKGFRAKKSLDFGVRQPKSGSQLYHLLALGPWATDAALPASASSTCETEMSPVSQADWVEETG